MHNVNNVSTAGAPLDQAKTVMIMIHGRGASADSILSLSQYFQKEGLAFIAPQATGGTWYPYSFLAPMEENEPGLSAGLDTISRLVANLKEQYGINQEQVYLLGFSQGACLSLEFAARKGGRFAGVFGLSGGLIGPPGTPRDYQHSLEGTPVLLGCSDADHHIPKERVIESGVVFDELDAEVRLRLYPNFGHNINQDELDAVNEILAQGTWAE